MMMMMMHIVIMCISLLNHASVFFRFLNILLGILLTVTHFSQTTIAFRWVSFDVALHKDGKANGKTNNDLLQSQFVFLKWFSFQGG